MEAGLTPDALDIARINWSAAWARDLQNDIQPVLAHQDWCAGLNAVAQERELTNHRSLPLRFVEQSMLPSDMAYEAFISETGNVPTRRNLHDFFNGLMWLSYPCIKKQLNALQTSEILKSGRMTPAIGPTRGKLRDAVTIFDENAALFVSADEKIIDALRAHDWNTLFLVNRSAFGSTCKVFLFGHALMEKLVSPYKAITAHAWVVKVEASFFDLSEKEQKMQLDQHVATQLLGGLTTADFTPLPVLGIPGWAERQDEAYYGDQTVFRPKKIVNAK